MVVSITNISPSHGSRYYAQEGSYLEEEQGQSNWCGQLASDLGVRGEVETESFNYLLQGRSTTGELLLQRRLQPHARERAGIDLTTSAPKSVSLQALVFGDRLLETAHRQATAQMLNVLESRYAFTRWMQNGERTRIWTGKLAIAQFHHDSSRDLDPQLHTHNVILNLQRLPTGGWRSLDNEPIYWIKMLLGRIYRNELAQAVQQLGYGIQVTDERQGFWELSGFSSNQLEQFSKRSQQIQHQAGEDASSQHKAWIALSSRRKEKQMVPRAELTARWQEEAALVGLNAASPGQIQKVEPDLAQALIQMALERLAQQKTKFRREELERTALMSIGQVHFSELQTAIDQHPGLTKTIDPKGRDLYTYHPPMTDTTYDIQRLFQPGSHSPTPSTTSGLQSDNTQPPATPDNSWHLSPLYPISLVGRNGLAAVEPSDSSDSRPVRPTPAMAQTSSLGPDSDAAVTGDSATCHQPSEYGLGPSDGTIPGAVNYVSSPSESPDFTEPQTPEREPDRH